MSLIQESQQPIVQTFLGSSKNRVQRKFWLLINLAKNLCFLFAI